MLQIVNKELMDKALSVGILIDETCSLELLKEILREDYRIIAQVIYPVQLSSKSYCDPSLVKLTDNGTINLTLQKGVAQRIFTEYNDALTYTLLIALNYIK